MTLTTQILSFAASAQQFPAAPGIGLCCRVFAQPLRRNTHACSIGGATVTSDGTGVGVMQELAVPPASTIPLDQFNQEDRDGNNRIDPTVFYAQGYLAPATSLNGAITTVATAVVVTSGVNIVNGQYITVMAEGAKTTEIMLVTAGGGTANLTV